MKRLFSLSAICLCVSMMAMIASVSADDPGEGEGGGGGTTINEKCTNPSYSCNQRGFPYSGINNACHLGADNICGTPIFPATDCDCTVVPTSPINATSCYCEAT